MDKNTYLHLHKQIISLFRLSVGTSNLHTTVGCVYSCFASQMFGVSAECHSVPNKDVATVLKCIIRREVSQYLHVVSPQTGLYLTYFCCIDSGQRHLDSRMKGKPSYFTKQYATKYMHNRSLHEGIGYIIHG